MLSIVKQLLQAVNYLHSRQIVHRDLRLDTVEVYNSETAPCDVRIQLKSMHRAI